MMKSRPYVTLALLLLAACGPDARTAGESDGAVAEAATLDDRAGAERTTGVFVTRPPSGARLAFVGQDSTVRPAVRADALFLPFSIFSVERDGIPNELPPADSLAALLERAGVRDERIVIVGDPIPVGRAYAGFDFLGLGDRVAILDGGVAAAEAVPAGSPAPGRDGSAERIEVDVRDDMIVDARWVHERLDDPVVAILDARPPAEFTGETPGAGVGRPGHIPGARNVYWQTLVDATDGWRLRDEAELRAVFEAAGADPGDTIVAYCRTGGQASFLYAVAKHLGYDVVLYDGSFVDWSRTDYPVER